MDDVARISSSSGVDGEETAVTNSVIADSLVAEQGNGAAINGDVTSESAVLPNVDAAEKVESSSESVNSPNKEAEKVTSTDLTAIPDSELSEVDKDKDHPSQALNEKHVKFGAVRVHTHRMTLGANPSTTRGVPVELAWEVDESMQFENPSDFDAYTSSEHGSSEIWHDGDPHGARRITAASREHIASVNHSRESIVKAQQEVMEIKKSRMDSSKDKDEVKSRRMQIPPMTSLLPGHGANGTKKEAVTASPRRKSNWLSHWFARK
jgi:hypothetical protein